MLIATLTGFAGRDPDSRYTAAGRMFSTFSVAHNTWHRDPEGGSEPIKDTEWIRVTGWGKAAEQIEAHVQKGSKVTVHGYISVNRYRGRDGEAKAQIQMDVIQIDMDRGSSHARGPDEGTAEYEMDGAIDAGEYEEATIPGFET